MNLTFIQGFLIASFSINVLLVYMIFFRKSQSERARFQLKSNLLSRITHELRTPLHAVIGLSQVLEKESQLPPNLKKTVISVKENGIYLLSLINDFLDLSKVESGQMVLEMEQFSIHRLWDSLLNLFSYRFQEKGINLTIQLLGFDFNSTFLGDFRKIQQTLINLISNALKFTDVGQVTLEIKRQEKPNQGHSLVRFSVIDSGKGISPAELPTVFEPFWQSRQTDSISGTGLGLSIAKQMVEILGGILKVESKLTKGSRFDFELVLIERPSGSENSMLPLELGFEQGISPEEERRLVIAFCLKLDTDKKRITLKSLKVQQYSDLHSILESVETEELFGKEIFLSKLQEKKTRFLIDLYNQLQREMRS